jgi:ectoine hydroxylase-related dioxygenase (phytanoyl-CoA dioxygenase family)
MDMPRTLTQDEIDFYNEQGYLVLKDVIPADVLNAASEETERMVSVAKTLTEAIPMLDLDPSHTPEKPRVRRIKSPHEHSEHFRALAGDPVILDLLDPLMPSGVRIHNTKVNMKSAGVGESIEWHQDWAFYPHTNDDMLAFGLMLEDVDQANGPLMVIPGSHKGPLLSHHNNGVFAGAVDPDDPDFHFDRAVTLTGKAGSMTVHHARTLHGSAPNKSDRARLILFFEACAADAWPLLGAGAYMHRLPQREMWADLLERMICGEPVIEPRIEKVPVRLPLPPAPDAGSIFKTQKSGGARSVFAA